MSQISATAAARNFADLLDAIEHRGEHVAIVRRGRAVAQPEPVRLGRRAGVKDFLRSHPVDEAWLDDVVETRSVARVRHRS